MEGNLRKYEAFIAVSETKNFTRAAERLSYTQSTISKMIKSLEQEWEIVLFTRGAGETNVRLTAEGERMLPLVRKLCSDYLNVEMEAADIANLKKGTLRIGTFSSTAINVLPEALEKYHEIYPNIEFELLLGDYDEIESWLNTGRVDCGFLRLPIESELDTFFVCRDEYIAVLPGNHPLASRDRVSSEELSREPVIVLERGSALREGYDIFVRDGLNPKVIVRTWDDNACLAMVERGLGVAIEPELMVTRTPYDVVLKQFTEPMFRDICFAVPDITSAPKTVRVLLDCLLESRPGCPDPL